MRPACALVVVASLVACEDKSAALPSAGLFSSGGGTEPTPDSGTPEPGPLPDTPAHCASPLSWANTGEPYLLTYCSGCHTSTVAEDFRYGAPPELVLDSADDVFAHSVRIQARIEDGTMPPTGGPSADENACFLAWLGQGARGLGDALPAGPGSPTAVAAWEVLETVDLHPDFPEGLTFVSTHVGLGRPVTHGVWLTEHWLVDGDDAWLVARERFDTDGRSVAHDTWEPPLLFSTGASGDSWTTDTVRTRVDDSGVVELTEVWDFVRDVGVSTDPRSIDTAPVRIVGVERGTGIEQGLELSDVMGPVHRWRTDHSATADPTVDHLDVYLFESRLPPLGSGFPLVAGMEWSARILGDPP